MATAAGRGAGIVRMRTSLGPWLEGAVGGTGSGSSSRQGAPPPRLVVPGLRSSPAVRVGNCANGGREPRGRRRWARGPAWGRVRPSPRMGSRRWARPGRVQGPCSAIGRGRDASFQRLHVRSPGSEGKVGSCAGQAALEPAVVVAGPSHSGSLTLTSK